MLGYERLTPQQQKRLVELKPAVVEHFDAGSWTDLGLLTGCMHEVQDHSRLLRSLSFQDDDYSTCAIGMLVTMAQKDPKNFAIIDGYVTNLGGGGVGISTAEGKKRVYFNPSIFDIPDEDTDPKLVAVMMPFDKSFDGVYVAIKDACWRAGLTCQRVDDMWEHSTLIQDIFSLIWRANIVVCDFTGKNANVFYECGIAHTLGKHVVPIAQHQSDVPFDLQHHRYLQYHSNVEGLTRMQGELQKRLSTLAKKVPWQHEW